MTIIEKTRMTAEKIAAVCNEIDDCMEAIKALKSKQQPDSVTINILRDENDEGITVYPDRGAVKEALEKTLFTLNKTYESLVADLRKEVLE